MVLDVGAARHACAQLHDVGLAAGLLLGAVPVELFTHRDDVYRPLLHIERLDGPVDDLMTVVVETLGLQDFAHLGIGLLLNHQSAQDGSLHVEVLGLLVSEGVHLGHLDYLCFVAFCCCHCWLIRCSGLQS